jgi:hypothetical protein
MYSPYSAMWHELFTCFYVKLNMKRSCQNFTVQWDALLPRYYDETENMASFSELLIVVHNGTKCTTTMHDAFKQNNGALRHASLMPTIHAIAVHCIVCRNQIYSSKICNLCISFDNFPKIIYSFNCIVFCTPCVWKLFNNSVHLILFKIIIILFCIYVN